MKAIVVTAPGGPEGLELQEVEAPRAEPDQVLIDVHATALNRADLLQRRGLYPAPPGAPATLGLECAGIVASVGTATSSIAPGTRVMALLAGGGYAERVAVSERLVMPIPDQMGFEHAAAVPEAFLTADEALFGLAGVEPGEVVLVHSSAGGVGTAAVQLARAAGARVVAVASGDDKLAAVRNLGADLVIDRKQQDYAEVLAAAGLQVDVVLDTVGAPYAARHLTCLGERGRWVVLGLLGGAEATLDLSRVLRKRLQILGLVMRTRSVLDKAEIVARFQRRWLPALAQGSIAPLVDSVFPLAQAADAHRRMEQNLNIGKIVLSVA